MMVRPSSVLPLLAATASMIVFHATPAQAECDQCFFTSDDADDCRVYGKIDSVLVSWEKASEDCKDAYSIVITSIDPSLVGCDPDNVNTFVNSGINAGAIPTSVRAGLGVAEGYFFKESGRRSCSKIPSL